MEMINRRTWSSPLSRRDYRNSSGFINEGERVVLGIGLANSRGGSVLDIGIGGGRTAALLAREAANYVGIDYTPEMVTLARSNHLGLCFENMDARDLSAFANGSFDLVVFSYNGIDSVDADGRKSVLREVSRVLKAGGTFAFSTFNRNWHGFGQNRARSSIVWSNHPVKLSFRLLKHAMGMVRECRFAPLEERDGEHAILLHRAHDFGIMVYATTPGQLRSQLTESGFTGEPLLFSVDGRPLDGEMPANEEYFHVLARKPSLS
ncbi:class I SAM-dependent methyltransferase [Rhizobium viscosum]|uniref:SAM-dependent methyltransferase n=1 Tax=Rhizobium viscosum TaxID=1673 RepID=A0ABR9IPF6_RHIVS|nr:class I SAM-dependent methyltransferase [Rhizobium viscosum]MBE1505028.1 SAM-dependent methyltransferase [Rhizobium viscosum]